MAKNFENGAAGQLNAAITNVATTLVLKAGQGAAFPSSDFWVTLYSSTMDDGLEIALCSSRSSDTLTISRGEQGTSGQAWAEDNFCVNAFTAADFDLLLTGATGATVQDMTTFQPTKKYKVTIDAVDYWLSLDPV